jgi:hypothetical protein
MPMMRPFIFEADPGFSLGLLRARPRIASRRLRRTRAVDIAADTVQDGRRLMTAW